MLLLVAIYFSFVVVGFGDSIIGAAWPSMQTELAAQLGIAGIITAITTGGKVLASFLSNKACRKFGTGVVEIASMILFALSMYVASIAQSIFVVIIGMFGAAVAAATIDVSLNNYVSAHYSAKAMSLLHMSGSVGSTIAPFIISLFLGTSSTWRGGFRAIALIGLVLGVALVFVLSKWERKQEGPEIKTKAVPIGEAIAQKGAKKLILSFFLYTSLELSLSTWTSSFLVAERSTTVELAAKAASVMYIGKTLSRFLLCFIANKVGERKIVRVGLIPILIGCIGLVLPINNTFVTMASLFLIGFGIGPFFPEMVHLTPKLFGQDNADTIMGLEFSSGYIGSALMPLLVGYAMTFIGTGVMPFITLGISVILLFII